MSAAIFSASADLSMRPKVLVLSLMDHSPGFLQLVNETKKRVKEISVEGAARETKTSKVVLIDVREDNEWGLGHAAGAIHLGRGVLERDIETRVPDRETKILCYCGGGFRSALAADNLQKMGYTNVWSVAGGYKAWVSAGLPVNSRPSRLPRSPHEKLGGLVHLPRLIDKARLFPAGQLPGYNYLHVGFDKHLLEFLCLDAGVFERAVRDNATDAEVLGWLKAKLGPSWPSDHAVTEFNDKLLNRRPDSPEKMARFEQLRASLPPSRKKVETYCDLIDLEEGRLA
jgi:rhodanese-related sulfurtransferase